MDNIQNEVEVCQPLLAALEKHFHRKLSPEQWIAVQQTQWFARWRDGDAETEDVLADAEEFLRQIQVLSAPIAPEANKKPVAYDPPDQSIDEAISDLLAWQVEEDFMVDLMRIRVWFGGGHLSDDELYKVLLNEAATEAAHAGGSKDLLRAEDWFSAEAKKLREELLDRTDSLFGLNAIWDARAQQHHEQNAAYDLHGDHSKWYFGAPMVGLISLYFDLDRDGGKWLAPVQVPYYERWGRLHEVDTFAEFLSQTYHWSYEHAFKFILQRKVPRTQQVGVRLEMSVFAGWWNDAIPSAKWAAVPSRLHRLILTVDPTVAPKDVEAVYSSIRRNGLNVEYHKALSTKHAALARFAFAPERASMGWSARMIAWNKLRTAEPVPDFKGRQTYTDVAQFKHHCLMAKERLLNPRYAGFEGGGQSV